MRAWPGKNQWDMVEGSTWQSSKRQVMQAIRQIGTVSVRDQVKIANEATMKIVGELNQTPQGMPLDTPPARTSEAGPFDKGPSGNAWWASVVETLSRQHNLGVSWGNNRLAQGMTLGERAVDDTFIAGYASRDQLDDLTRYKCRIILQRHVPTPMDRGIQSHDSSEPRTRPPRPQVIWWNWDLQKWQSASVAAYPDGHTEVIFGSSGKQIPNWRGAIPSGSGYWADQEFGTMGRQVAPGYVPQVGDDYMMVFLGHQGIGVAELRASAGDEAFAIRPALFLAAGAEVVMQLYTPRAESVYRAGVRGLLGANHGP